MKRVNWKNTNLTSMDMPYFIAHNEADMKELGNKIPGKISLLYTNWSKETTYKLAGLHARGVRVFIKSTEIVSPRYPRPYVINATADELKEVKRLSKVQNNKTCYTFVKNAFKVITKGYGVDPRHSIDIGGDYPHYRVSITDKRFPKTDAFQQALQGIEEGLALTVNPIEDFDKVLTSVEHKCKLYADQMDCYTHTVTNTVAPFEKELDERSYRFLQVDTYTDEHGITHEHRQWRVGRAYNRERYFAENTEEVFTWKDTPRDKGNNSSQVYLTDVRDTVSTQKLKEAEEVLNWLEEHDMLDMNAYHCPNCGKIATTYNGCAHCGYELPKEAISEFNNGRITEAELSAMSIEDINALFNDTETATSYQEWQNFNNEDEFVTDELTLTNFDFE